MLVRRPAPLGIRPFLEINGQYMQLLLMCALSITGFRRWWQLLLMSALSITGFRCRIILPSTANTGAPGAAAGAPGAAAGAAGAAAGTVSAGAGPVSAAGELHMSNSSLASYDIHT